MIPVEYLPLIIGSTIAIIILILMFRHLRNLDK